MPTHSESTDTAIKTNAGNPNGVVTVEVTGSNAELLLDTDNDELYFALGANNGTTTWGGPVVSGGGGGGSQPLYSIGISDSEFWYNGSNSVVKQTGSLIWVETLTDLGATANNAVQQSPEFEWIESTLDSGTITQDKGSGNTDIGFTFNSATASANDMTVFICCAFDTSLTALVLEDASGFVYLTLDPSSTLFQIDTNNDTIFAFFTPDEDPHIYVFNVSGLTVNMYLDGGSDLSSGDLGTLESFTWTKFLKDSDRSFQVRDCVIVDRSLSVSEMNVIGNAIADHVNANVPGTITWTDIT